MSHGMISDAEIEAARDLWDSLSDEEKAEYEADAAEEEAKWAAREEAAEAAIASIDSDSDPADAIREVAKALGGEDLVLDPETGWADWAVVTVSAEDSTEYGLPLADYYGEFRGGYPWIDPLLVDAAEALGGYWEWINPGVIALAIDA